jgi:hypothetical protein
MMKYLLAVYLILLVAIACNNGHNGAGNTQQTRVIANNTEKNIYQSGDSMLAAFRRKDWITFVKYNHPNMVKRMGGEQAFASFVDLQMKQFPDSAIKAVSLGNILQVVKTDKDKQCVVEQNMEINVEGRNFNKKTYLIGQCLDGGNSWTFFDASTKTLLAPIDIKPDLSPELKIPSVH